MARYRRVRAVIRGVTHDALEDRGRAVTTACGTPCGLATLHEVSILAAGVPEVDCMACIAAKTTG